jgi:hypothetical protein
MFGTEYFKSKE